jgi:ArsR family transcriptional regulator
MYEGEAMDELVRAARSLGDEQRVRVLNLLMQRECCVCEVMQALDISQVNASRYCHALQDAGFVRMRKEGRWRHYRVDRDCVPALRDMMQAVQDAARTEPVLRADVARLSKTRRCSGSAVPALNDGFATA